MHHYGSARGERPLEPALESAAFAISLSSLSSIAIYETVDEMHEVTLLEQVLAKAAEVREIGRLYGTSNPRIFGSVARHEADQNSDIDILIDPGPRCALLSIGGMTADLEDLFGRHVDVRTLFDLHPKMRDRVLAEAITL